MTKLMVLLVICPLAIIVTAGDQSSDSILGPFPFVGIDGYGCVYAKSSEDGRVYTHLVKLLRDDRDPRYETIDSFVTIGDIKQYGKDEICFVTREHSCLHMIALGPFPDTGKDTLVSSCMSDSVIWSLFDYFVSKDDSLLAYILYVPCGDPIRSWRCLIGGIGECNRIDTAALLYGVNGCYPSLEGTEVFLDVLFDPDQNNWSRHTVGVYDLVADSLLTPLDTAYDTWGGTRLGRDKPLYYIKSHPVHGHNVWRWDPDWGEELVTFFPKPDVVRGFELTADSLICFVGMEGDSASTGLTRVAFPIDAE